MYDKKEKRKYIRDCSRLYGPAFLVRKRGSYLRKGEVMEKKVLGRIGENMAEEMLKAEGYEIIRRNYYTRYGEIDIIASKADVIYFCEVKTRMNLDYGLPREAVTRTKVNHMKHAASEFLMELGEVTDIDFMVIEIYADMISDFF